VCAAAGGDRLLAGSEEEGGRNKVENDHIFTTNHEETFTFAVASHVSEFVSSQQTDEAQSGLFLFCPQPHAHSCCM